MIVQIIGWFAILMGVLNVSVSSAFFQYANESIRQLQLTGAVWFVVATICFK